MSIIIKGMEMPKSCFECRFSIDGFCQAMEPGSRTDDDKAQVSNWCPLVEVPTPHGRLIDADAFGKTLKSGEVEAHKRKAYVFEGILNTIRGNLANAPTIIEAEE